MARCLGWYNSRMSRRLLVCDKLQQQKHGIVERRKKRRKIISFEWHEWRIQLWEHTATEDIFRHKTNGLVRVPSNFFSANIAFSQYRPAHWAGRISTNSNSNAIRSKTQRDKKTLAFVSAIEFSLLIEFNTIPKRAEEKSAGIFSINSISIRHSVIERQSLIRPFLRRTFNHCNSIENAQAVMLTSFWQANDQAKKWETSKTLRMTKKEKETRKIRQAFNLRMFSVFYPR